MTEPWPDPGAPGRAQGRGAGVVLGEAAVVALALVLLHWYRLRYALPAPLGGHRLLRRRLRAWGAGAATGGEAPRRSGPATRLERLFRGAIGRAPLAGGCVAKSLALARLLRLHGLPAELRVGMRRTREGFAGHAWVVHHGAVIAQPREFVNSFVALDLARGSAMPRIEGAP